MTSVTPLSDLVAAHHQASSNNLAEICLRDAISDLCGPLAAGPCSMCGQDLAVRVAHVAEARRLLQRRQRECDAARIVALTVPATILGAKGAAV